MDTQAEIVLLDSAMGTRLEEMGLTFTEPLWTAKAVESHIDKVMAIHKENIDAGAQIITTASTRTTPFAYHKAGYSGVESHTLARNFTTKTIRAAQKSIKDSGKDVKIAGCITTLGECLKPEEYPGGIFGRPWHDAQLDVLDDKNVDVILAESINGFREAKLITDLALKRTKPIWLCFLLKDEATIWNGDDLVTSAVKLEKIGVSAVGVNCTTTQASLKAIKLLKAAVSIPIIVLPNLGKSTVKSKKMGAIMPPDQFAEWTKKAVKAGATIIGACGGSNAEHIKHAHDALFKAPV